MRGVGACSYRLRNTQRRAVDGFACKAPRPLTPILSPQAGRGGAVTPELELNSSFCALDRQGVPPSLRLRGEGRVRGVGACSEGLRSSGARLMVSRVKPRPLTPLLSPRAGRGGAVTPVGEQSGTGVYIYRRPAVMPALFQGRSAARRRNAGRQIPAAAPVTPSRRRRRSGRDRARDGRRGPSPSRRQ